MFNTSILSFFWKHIKPYKWYYLLMMIAPLFTAFYGFAYNYSVKLFLDAMEAGVVFSYRNVLLPIILFLTTQLVLNLVWRVSSLAERKAEPQVRRSILLQSYNYVQHHSYTFFQDNFTGALSSKLKGLLDGYDKFWGELHHGLIIKVLVVIVNLSVLLWLNTYLGAFILVWILFYVPIMYQLSKKLNLLAFDETESRHRLMGQISDRITNIFTLFSFTSRKWELKRLDHQISTDFLPKQIKLYKYDVILQVVGGVFYSIISAFVLFFMIYLRQREFISIGDFALALSLTFLIVENSWEGTVKLQEFSREMGDLKSALSILTTPQRNLDLPNAQPLIVKQPTIDFEEIIFHYDKGKAVFKKLSLHIKSGEKVGLVGRSGAGKSSLVNLLLRYFDPEKGTISIDGKDIQKVTQDSLRAHIAVIPQDTMLFHRSIMENIHYGRPEATEAEVIAASKKAHIHDFILTLPEQYQTHVGERGIKLSGGQSQRISIARAILKDAPILILDEATAALDSQTEQLIQDSLRFFIEAQQKTVIAIAHRLSTLKHMDRLLVLEEGKIIEEGTHDQLIQQEGSLYKQLWEYQDI